MSQEPSDTNKSVNAELYTNSTVQALLQCIKFMLVNSGENVFEATQKVLDTVDKGWDLKVEVTKGSEGVRFSINEVTEESRKNPAIRVINIEDTALAKQTIAILEEHQQLLN